MAVLVSSVTYLINAKRRTGIIVRRSRMKTLNEVIDAMEQTGALMSPTLKESSQAGLAVTPTGLEVKKKVFG